MLQDHHDHVRYRNIWIRRLAGYDLPGKIEDAPAASSFDSRLGRSSTHPRGGSGADAPSGQGGNRLGQTRRRWQLQRGRHGVHRSPPGIGPQPFRRASLPADRHPHARHQAVGCQPGHAARGMRRGALGPGAEDPSLGEDESYQLDVAPDGARLKAATVAGALHGLETFAQLVAPGAEGFQVPAVHIEDRPRFPWRGLMLDVSRHWMPVEVVERNLDAMAAVKLNVFHWHLSDDQGFRVESRRFPRLQQLGSDGNFYTQADIRHVVAYARDRGIRVVPEFDMPGHTNSWLVGYPELASAPGSVQHRPHLGRLRWRHGPDPRGDLRVSRRLPRRDDAALPRPVFPHRRRRGERQAVEPVRFHSSLRQRAQAGRHARPPGVLQPAHSEAAAEVREDHGGVGRGAAPRSPGGHRGAILARAGIAGRGGDPKATAEFFRPAITWTT